MHLWLNDGLLSNVKNSARSAPGFTVGSSQPAPETTESEPGAGHIASIFPILIHALTEGTRSQRRAMRRLRLPGR